MKNYNLIFLLLFIAIEFSFTKKTITPAWEVSTKEEFTTVYEKSTGWFSKNLNYKVNVKYASYTDHSSAIAYEQSSGYFKRSNNYIHSSALGIRTIQNEKFCIMIDSLNQLIVLNNKKKVEQSLFDEKTFMELLSKVKSIKKQKHTSGEMIYQLEFPTNGLYSKYEFQLNAQGLPSVMKYYYSKEMKKDEEDENSLKGKPRLEVSFSGYQTNVNFVYDKEFSEKQFLNIESNKVVLNEKYKNFEIKDYRFAVKN